MPNISINSLPDPVPFSSCSETFRESLRQMADDLAAKKAAAAAKPKVRVAMDQPDVEDAVDISLSDKGSPNQ